MPDTTETEATETEATETSAVDDIKPMSTYRGEPIWNQRLMALRIAQRLGWLVFLFPVNPHETDPSELSYAVIASESPAPLDINDPDQRWAFRIWSATEVLPTIHALGIAHGVPHLTAYREGME